MKISYIAFLSLQNLRKRKLRSFLTIGGMSIGISAIVFLVSLGFGLQRLITSQVTDIEALTILDVSSGTSTLLKIDNEVVNTFKGIDKVIEVSPSYSVSGQVSKEGSVTDIAIFGINPEYAEIENIKTSLGEMFADPDASNSLISTTAAELLGVNALGDIIGETVTFRVTVEKELTGEDAPAAGSNEPTVITEVIEIPTTVSGLVDDELTLAYLPLNVLEVIEPDNFSLARIKVASRDDLVAVRSEIEQLGYQVDSIADTVGQIDQIFVVFEIIMAGFGLIAMLVASLGAFNTLTVSLLERTREVGIMKALGTSSKDVYQIFISEAFIIGFAGGGSGLLFGYLFGEAANVVINYLATRYGGESVDIFYTPIMLVLVVFAIIVVVSFITGVYPARRASKLNPLDALRYE
ncbi:MAG: FtsX-like permease family protein [bacterium]